MADSSTTEPVPDIPYDLRTSRDTINRWLKQGFEAGWDVARHFPNDKVKPDLMVTWEETASDGGVSPLLTYVRKS